MQTIDTIQPETLQTERYLWTRQDTINAKAIFQSPTWEKIMEIAKRERPKIKGTTREDRCDQAIEFQTWESFLTLFPRIASGQYEDQPQETLGMEDMSVPRNQR